MLENYVTTNTTTWSLTQINQAWVHGLSLFMEWAFKEGYLSILWSEQSNAKPSLVVTKQLCSVANLPPYPCVIFLKWVDSVSLICVASILVAMYILHGVLYYFRFNRLLQFQISLCRLTLVLSSDVYIHVFFNITGWHATRASRRDTRGYSWQQIWSVGESTLSELILSLTMTCQILQILTCTG